MESIFINIKIVTHAIPNNLNENAIVEVFWINISRISILCLIAN